MAAGLIWGLITGIIFTIINHRRYFRGNEKTLDSKVKLGAFSLFCSIVFFIWIRPGGFENYLLSAALVSLTFGVGTFISAKTIMSIWGPEKFHDQALINPPLEQIKNKKDSSRTQLINSAYD
ncbi:TPA: hypothetical protein JAJ93_001468 [Corynebacterium striatum]|nr:hypothetical protein [Corynebacterium striatum]HAT1284450.1 hypothetical protein [Corynebacterium striatum]HAT1396823.1 hypothetical protein [Corynebacterium striatum]HAT6385155.1 hypothetical protein [Corynebacterium striatum]HAT6408328.1 hypothetical protein [Corynebacterium striatum]